MSNCEWIWWASSFAPISCCWEIGAGGISPDSPTDSHHGIGEAGEVSLLTQSLWFGQNRGMDWNEWFERGFLGVLGGSILYCQPLTPFTESTSGLPATQFSLARQLVGLLRTTYTLEDCSLLRALLLARYYRVTRSAESVCGNFCEWSAFSPRSDFVARTKSSGGVVKSFNWKRERFLRLQDLPADHQSGPIWGIFQDTG